MKFTVEMEPVPKARSRLARNKACSTCPYGKVHSYTPDNTSNAEAFIRASLPRHHQFYPKGTALWLEVTFYLTRPRSCPKKRKLPCVRFDLDNAIKLVMDSLRGEGGCFTDDGQVTTLISRKRYSDSPRIEIEIMEDSE